MGLLSDIFGFIDDLTSGSSYYKENSIEWCDWDGCENCITEKEAKQEASRCLRCDHFGYGILRGGRDTKW